MRQIKFRLRIQKTVVGYEKWYSGQRDADGLIIADPKWLYSKEGEFWNQNYIYHKSKDQFTGLKDKNGNEIYEGDIVHAEVAIRMENSNFIPEDCQGREICRDEYDGKIVFEDAIFLIKGDDDLPLQAFAGVHTEDRFVEIIGNIHENPELLK